MARQSQLRIYTIKSGRMKDFVKGWTDGIAPLRRSFGYQVDGAWIMDKENRFVWIVSSDGTEDWDRLYKRYMTSDGRKALQPDPAQWIEKSESWLMTHIETEA